MLLWEYGLVDKYMMICFLSKVLRLYGEDYADYSGVECDISQSVSNLTTFLLFVYFPCPFRRCLSQMEFKRWPFVGVRSEVIIAVTNKFMALLHVKARNLVNT